MLPYLSVIIVTLAQTATHRRQWDKRLHVTAAVRTVLAHKQTGNCTALSGLECRGNAALMAGQCGPHLQISGISGFVARSS